jgi:inner membrane protein
MKPIIMAITDLRGINKNPYITLGEDNLPAEPSNNIGIMTRKFTNEIVRYTYSSDNAHTSHSGNGIIVPLNWQSETDFNGKASMKLQLRGSNRLSFVPSGKTTAVTLKGPGPIQVLTGSFCLKTIP